MKNWISVGVALASVSSFANELTGWNNPANFSNSYERELSALPQSGTVPTNRIPWSESFWPANEGGIAVRWNWGGASNFKKNKLYSMNELLFMNEGFIARLSPAEKFDILMGRYDYPTVKGERARVSRLQADWHGICNGWTAASLNHEEPAAVTLVNADGIRVPFGSSDVKALLSYYYAVVESQSAGQIGSRCSVGIQASKTCKDVNPGAFHIALANEIGMKRRGFAIEIDPTGQVWNQPMYAYSSRIVGEGSPSRRDRRRHNVDREVTVETTISYGDDGVDYPRMYPTNGTSEHHTESKTYRYTLKLNYAGEIIGGEWLQKNHPDFIWLAPRANFSHSYYGNILTKVYRPAR